ncbi:MAG: type I methionyl aminopeptidase [Candidatus Komeilibacteria bacterium]|nr:type I methionyl aminopeptidase [Candidatus Komeilibacteria bacterium]
MIIQNNQELEILKTGGKKLRSVLNQLAAAVRPGVTTWEIDQLAEKLILAVGGTPSFKNYGTPKFPGTICASVNSEVVHGIPGNLVLAAGDIFTIDIGMWYQGLCTDTAVTVPVGKVSSEVKKLLKVTEESLNRGLKQVVVGKRIGDIGWAVQSYVESQGFSIVRQLTGHGVGKAVHEDPPVPNFGRPGTGPIINQNEVLALEPIVSAGDWRIKTKDDRWTIVTQDGSLSAHFEHTVIATAQGPLIIT